jgi:hypothetical protein
MQHLTHSIISSTMMKYCKECQQDKRTLRFVLFLKRVGYANRSIME